MATATAPITDFSRSEIKQRAANVQAAMKAKGWEALLIIDEETVGQGCSVRYLAGLSHIKPPSPGFMVIGQSGDPVMVMGGGMGGAAFNLVEQFVAVKIKPVEGRPPDWPGTLAAALTEVGYKGGPLPVDGVNLLRDNLAQGLKSKFSNLSFVNANRTVERVRMYKSETELVNYRKAAEMSYNGMEIFMKVIEPGVTNNMAVEEATHSTIIQGGEENLLIHGSGTPWVWGLGWRGDSTFQEGDLVSVELNARYHGYYAQVCRTWGLGKISAEQQKSLDAVKAGTEKMYDVLKPGMTGKEAFHAGLAEVKKWGFDFCNVRFGHGVGLTIGEGYDFADWDTAPDGPCSTPIPEGAFGNFHPFLIASGPNGRGTFNALWGDPWVMRAHGLRCSSRTGP